MKKRINYRKLWEQYHGRPIPKDEFGRSFDIHHLDGDITNNTKENLYACSIQEHYDIHFEQEDWGACYMLAKRMKMSPELISELNKKNQMKRVENGTHHLLGPSHNKKRIENGTHHLLGSSHNNNRVKNGTHPWVGPKHNNKRIAEGIHPFVGGEVQRRRVADGSHHLLGGEIQRRTHIKRLADGSHHLLGDRNPSHKRINDGSHNFLGVYCYDKYGNKVQVSKYDYNKQKEITSDKTNWEFVHVTSIEGKRRKLLK